MITVSVRPEQDLSFLHLICEQKQNKDKWASISALF
jgi:hypothetical protein